MNADIDERSSSLLIFFDEHAPGRNTPAAKRLGAGIVNLAHVTVIDVILQKHGGTGKASLESNLQDLSRFFGRLTHKLRLLGVHRQGLLAKHVLAGVQRIYRRMQVKSVGGRDGNGIDLLIFQKLSVIRVGFGDTELVRRFLGGSGVHIANGDHFAKVRRACVARHVAALGDAAAADNSDL